MQDGGKAWQGGCLSFCYEARPCGYGLHRLLTGCGPSCIGSRPGCGVRAASISRSPAGLAGLLRLPQRAV
ncbi:MAG: hypothetical protein E6G90_08990 [Alphaproteobacteria bacterium]|nr:MAG: hypothetical protein E6G90_08990 [Alphaproteobacteria bacterium]